MGPPQFPLGRFLRRTAERRYDRRQRQEKVEEVLVESFERRGNGGGLQGHDCNTTKKITTYKRT